MLDTFDSSESTPLTARAGWGDSWEGTFQVLKLSPDPDGARVIPFWKEWMVEGGHYGLQIIDGAETWWEKVNGAWVKRDG